ncbi:probable cytochrome P450 6a14 [Belonocnema kinseyi]|uniref:probable cytochrome P450 6a14 n=1 Tax=Belonocnema kinseyi TaxID=2817044 RepID=UPI00143D78A3|nr:probable cytochrome P450 6a14 [Belonocnema kinseyi]XP_033209033.1 probable cytochrome P450 6a14 [Belonocnema kinseyi]
MLERAELILRSKLFWSTTIVFGIYLYLKFVIFNYWKRKGIPHEVPIIPVGNILPVTLGKQCTGELIQESYERFKSNPLHGMYMFHIPHLVINDPDLIRLILIKNFAHFCDRGLYFNNDVDPLSGHLFFMPGDEWKHLRSKLSPTFTSGKMKQMFPLVVKVTEDLKKALGASIGKSSTVEVKDLLSRYTTDMIASIAFGVECNSLKNPDAKFREYGKKAVDINPVKVSLMMFFSKLMDILRIPINSKEVSKFFNTVFSDVIAHRKANNVPRKDFLDLLIQLMDHGKVEGDETNVTDNPKDDIKTVKNTEAISMSEACAQAFVFLIAGFETSSSTSTYCLHELALKPDIQDKLRQEINENLGGRHDFSYEDVHALPYLHKVVSETLRKYPIVPILNRICIKDYKIPNSNFCVPKGMNIIIPILGLHKDPNIFPDPEEFSPERFDSVEMAKRHAFTYLPFGEGPRICIGKRFGLLQVKFALIKILSHYRVSVCDKTEIRIKPTIRHVLLTPVDDVFLRVEKVS